MGSTIKQYYAAIVGKYFYWSETSLSALLIVS